MAEKIVVASGKGGVGKSTCAAGVAIALGETGKRVLMLDFDIGLGSLDVIFSVREKVVNNWGDIVLERCEKDDALIECGKIKLLPAPTNFDDAFTKENVAKMLAEFDDDYDYIILDAPAGIGKYFSLACECSDRGIVVSNPEDVCVRSAGVAADRMRETGISDVRLIINKLVKKFSVKKKNLNIDSVIDETSVRLIGVVPFDEDIGLISMENNLFRIKSKPQRSFERIARRVCGEDIQIKI